MYTVRKKNRNVEIINILVFCMDQNTLWDYRNQVQEIEGRTSCKINLTLTGRCHTVLDLIRFLQGGVDLYLSDSRENPSIGDNLIWRVFQKHPDCRMLERRGTHYYVGYQDTEQRGMVQWKLVQQPLQEQILTVIEQIRTEKADTNK